MGDLIFVLVIVVFFVAAYGLVRFAGRVTAGAEREIEEEIALDAAQDADR